MKLIKFISVTKPVYVNPEHIVSIEEYESICALRMVDGYGLCVNGPLSEVIATIERENEAANDAAMETKEAANGKQS